MEDASDGKQAGRAAGLGRPLVVSALARLRLLLLFAPDGDCCNLPADAGRPSRPSGGTRGAAPARAAAATTGAAAAPAAQPGAPVVQAPNRNAPPQQGAAAPPPAPPAPGAPQPQPPAEGTAFSLLITVANVSQQEIQQLTSRSRLEPSSSCADAL